MIGSLQKFYNKNGYVIIPDFIESFSCSYLISQFERLKKLSGFMSCSQTNAKSHFKSQYIAESHKISYFFTNDYIKDPSLDVKALIKVGHHIHSNQVFKKVTYLRKLKQIYQQLNIFDPIITQSMLLQKVPIKGGKVTLHQDSTYLKTQRENTLMGLWIPLQNVTTENGCIWGIPGSHLSDLRFKHKMNQGNITYEEDTNVEFNQENCIPLEMKKGSLLIMHGHFIHKSEENLSNSSRYAYTWHIMDQKKSKWCQDNWMSSEEIMKYQSKTYEEEQKQLLQ